MSDTLCKILIIMNSCDNSISGVGGCLGVHSASKNLVAALDPRKTVLELSYPHRCGCVMEPSLLGSCPCGLAWKRQQCNDSCCWACPVSCSSARETQVCDLPVLLGPKHRTQTLPWFTTWAIVPQNAGKGHKLTSFISSCVHSSVCALQSSCASPRFAVQL